VKTFYAVGLIVALAVPTHAQTIDDGIMMAKRALQAGDLYSYDSWDRYWEGALERANGNIGTVTTQANIWTANYGISDRFNVIGTVPYVWTDASQGVLHGIQGLQDLTLAGKYKFYEKTFQGANYLRAITVAAAGIPLTNYNPELPPLSIGSGSTRFSWRGTLNYQSSPGWFLNGSGSYTWRSAVTLDRPYYFTDDEFVMSDQADMPNTFDYVASLGYMKGGLMTAFSFSQLRTLGGGDIRRQDMPFVSNRMNASRVGGMIMAPIPKLRPLAYHLAAAYTVNGRNVGRATTFTAGILYTFQGSQVQ
jgi:hypothetical protein